VSLGQVASFRHAATAERSTRVEFERAVAPIMPDILSYFVRRVQPREDAADCLSETMVALWRHRLLLPRDESNRRAWAFGIARKVLLNQQRGRSREVKLADRVRSELRVASVADPDVTATVGDALEQLSETDRELVRLIVWDGFGVADAGALLGLRPSASRMRFARAKDKLRGLLL